MESWTENWIEFIHRTLSKYVLLSIGLWPNQSKLSRRIAFFIFSSSSFLLIVALTLGLLEKWSTNSVIIFENFLAILYTSTGLAKCTVLYMQDKKIYILFTKINDDWRRLTDKKELEILRSYTKEGRTVAFTYVLIGLPAFIGFGWMTFMPTLLNNDLVINYSNSFPYYFTYMIISENAHYCQICAHCVIVFSYIGVSYLAISYTFISSVKHVCGIYAIVCYRLQNVIHPRPIEPLIYLRKEKSIVYKLINIIHKHNEAISRINMIEQIFSKGFLIIEISALIGIALVVADVMCNQNNGYQIVRLFLVLNIFVIYVFYMNWTGEQVIQISSKVGLEAYSIEWFLMSIKVREMVHMIIRRSCKTDKLTVGSFVALSVQNFGSILKASWSTSTVLYSIQRHHRWRINF